MLLELKLVPNTYRPARPGRVYVLKCDHCQCVFEKPYSKSWLEKHKWGQFCSRKCYGRYRSEHPQLFADNTATMHTPDVAAKISASRLKTTRNPGYVHSWTGLKHSEETRALLRHGHVTSPRTGENNGMFGRRHKVESCDKMSETRTAMMLAGKYPTFGTRTQKGTYVSTKTGRSHFFRSGWEEAVMKHLDACDVVTTWNYECVRIPYMYNNNKRWYVPDFIVTFWGGESDMWEIKPKEFMNSQKNVLKESAAREWCKQNDVSSYRVLTGDDLKSMGVL